MPNITQYKGLEKYYFYKIINSIIEIAKLRDTTKIILDYGCGQKILSKILNNDNVKNYDINPEYSDFKSINNIKFDIVVMNHVLMYMSLSQIINLFNKIKLLNSDCLFVLGIGKQNFISKIAKNLSMNFDAHRDTKISYNDQINLINETMHIIDYKKNIFFMTDIYFTKFKS